MDLKPDLKPVGSFSQNEIDRGGTEIAAALDSLGIPRDSWVGQLTGRLSLRPDDKYALWVANTPVHPVLEGVKQLFSLGVENPEERAARQALADKMDALVVAIKTAKQVVLKRGGLLDPISHAQVLQMLSNGIIERLRPYVRE